MELELVEVRDHGKRTGPRQAYSDKEIPECEVIEAQNAAWHVIA